MRLAGVAGLGGGGQTGGARAELSSGETGAEGSPGGGAPWPTAIASLLVGFAFLALWFWLLPSWLGFRADAADSTRWRWVATVPAVLGFAVAVRCIWNFGWTGHGTPAPVAPPTRLVVVGFYKYVRNPMYLGFFLGWAGLWVVFGRASLAAMGVAGVAVLCTGLFVVLFEEPRLRRMFGAEYEKYCRNVPRWVPRLRAWER
jgi:protein-S-isoprenylcysteine O-methyltransferase Ste14